MITRVTKHPSRTRTLGPRDLDPRTLRVVRRMLDELRSELFAVASEHHPSPCAAGIFVATSRVDDVVRDLKFTERDERARLRRRQR